MTALSFAVYAIGCVAIVAGLELWTRYDLRRREMRDREMARKLVSWPSDGAVMLDYYQMPCGCYGAAAGHADACPLAAPDEPTRPATPVRKDVAP